MLCAVLGGVHGCVSALENALARVDSEGIHTIFCTGNLAAGHERPNEVLELLRARRIACVQGEQDRLVVRALRKASTLRDRLDDEQFTAITRAHDLLSSENVEFLRGLPRSITREMEGATLYLCHGTVTSQRDALRPDTAVDWFKRQREAANTDIVICGSDDEPFVRRLDVTLFANPGSLDKSGAFIIVNTELDPIRAEVVPSAS